MDSKPSVTPGSLSRNSIGPIPTTASETAFTTSASALSGSMWPCSRSSDSASSRTRNRRLARGIASSCRASTRPISRSCRLRRTSTSASVGFTTPPAPVGPALRARARSVRASAPDGRDPVLDQPRDRRGSRRSGPADPRSSPCLRASQVRRLRDAPCSCPFLRFEARPGHRDFRFGPRRFDLPKDPTPVGPPRCP
jgi:hypothetical protein